MLRKRLLVIAAAVILSLAAASGASASVRSGVSRLLGFHHQAPAITTDEPSPEPSESESPDPEPTESPGDEESGDDQGENNDDQGENGPWRRRRARGRRPGRRRPAGFGRRRLRRGRRLEERPTDHRSFGTTTTAALHPSTLGGATPAPPQCRAGPRRDLRSSIRERTRKAGTTRANARREPSTSAWRMKSGSSSPRTK